MSSKIRFYAPNITSTLSLPQSDSQHCVKVLRLKTGDTIEVVDGQGWKYDCRLVDPHPKHALVEIVESQRLPLCWDYNVTLAVAPTKHLDRMEWMVEKLTEIGVNRIVPLMCRYSERKEIKVERLEKIAIAAMKQSLKAVMPVIDEMTPLEDFVAQTPTDYVRFVAYCNCEIPRRLLAREVIPGRDTVIMIGPEGDFSIEEIRHTLDCGFIPATFGDNRLRTETAAVVAVDTVHIINQRDGSNL